MRQYISLSVLLITIYDLQLAFADLAPMPTPKGPKGGCGQGAERSVLLVFGLLIIGGLMLARSERLKQARE